jgi:hypothetical protein
LEAIALTTKGDRTTLRDRTGKPDDFTHIDRAPLSSWFGWGNQWFYQPPLRICEVTFICFSGHG